MALSQADPRPRSGLSGAPVIDLLDTLRRGAWDDALARVPSDATLTVPQFKLTTSGEGLLSFFAQARAQFPDLAYAPHSRRIGHEVVVDEGFFHGTPIAGPSAGTSMTSTFKCAVHHADGEIRLVTIDLDPTPLLVALGQPVNRAAALYSELQALRAGMYDDLEMHSLLSSLPPVPSQDRRAEPMTGPADVPLTGRQPRHRAQRRGLAQALFKRG